MLKGCASAPLDLDRWGIYQVQVGESADTTVGFKGLITIPYIGNHPQLFTG
jgi:hypothetical protein